MVDAEESEGLVLNSRQVNLLSIRGSEDIEEGMEGKQKRDDKGKGSETPSSWQTQ